MAWKLAELFVEIGAEMKPFNAALAGIRSRLAGLATMRLHVPGGGLMAMLGLGAGVAGAAGLKAMISGASDLNETVSKVGAVFGTQAKVVEGEADRMAKAFGIPKREFLDAASQFGLIATGMGQTQEQAAGMATHFARLAADAASFYNVPVDVALEKIRAGLTGESEPLKAFGVIMDETAVKAQAAAMGFKKVGGELSQEAKLAARSAIITKGLATATGDLEKTQGGMANQTREMMGRLTNLADSIGAKLLPAFLDLTHLVNEVLVDFTGSVDGMDGAFAGFVAWFKQGVATLGVVYRNWGSIVEIVGVTFREKLINMGELFEWLIGVAETELGWLQANWPKLIWDTFNAGNTMAWNALENLRGLVEATWKYLMDPAKGFEFKFKPLLDGFEKTMAELPKIAKPHLTSLQKEIDAIGRKIAEKEGARNNKVKDAVAGPKGGLPAQAGKAAVAAKDNKDVGKTHSLQDFAKHLQEGIFNKAAEKAAVDTAKGIGKIQTIQEKMLALQQQAARKPNVAVAGGPS